MFWLLVFEEKAKCTHDRCSVGTLWCVVDSLRLRRRRRGRRCAGEARSVAAGRGRPADHRRPGRRPAGAVAGDRLGGIGRRAGRLWCAWGACARLWAAAWAALTAQYGLQEGRQQRRRSWGWHLFRLGHLRVALGELEAHHLRQVRVEFNALPVLFPLALTCRSAIAVHSTYLQLATGHFGTGSIDKCNEAHGLQHFSNLHFR